MQTQRPHCVPKEALCLVGIVVWDFKYSPVVRLICACVMCTNVMCVGIVGFFFFFTHFMKLQTCYFLPLINHGLYGYLGYLLGGFSCLYI